LTYRKADRPRFVTSDRTAVEACDVYVLSVIDAHLYGCGRNGDRESLDTQAEKRLRHHSGAVAARRRRAAKALKLKSP
jgi:hypothetical protein